MHVYMILNNLAISEVVGFLWSNWMKRLTQLLENEIRMEVLFKDIKL